MIAASKLIHRVAILARTITDDAFGGEVETWDEVARRWTSVEFGSAASRRISAQERRVAGQEISSMTATFTMRFDSITQAIGERDHRLLHDGAEWDVESVAVDQRGGDVSITARRGARP